MIDPGLKFYVIGDPIEHSLSPVMQKFFLNKFKINGKYSAKCVKAEELEKVINSFIIQGVKGINVTTPHKMEVLKYVAELTQEAESIGSVNTIKVERGKLIGHNTDALGFQASLKILGYSFKNKNVIIFGAGGAARAVAVALIREQCLRIVIVNRNFEMAKKLVEDLSLLNSEIEYAALPTNCDEVERRIQSSQLLVNATTIGMGNLIDRSILLNVTCLHQDLFIYDLIYRPYKTRLIQQAESRYIRWTNGLDMLILQGIESLKFWIEQDLKLDRSSYTEIKNMLRRKVCLE